MVLLYIKISGENDVQVLRKLRNEFEELKIIILEHSFYSQYKVECLRYRADYFFSKSDEFDKRQIGGINKQVNII